MYKVKNLHSEQGQLLQRAIKEWVSTRKHIVLVSINVWYSSVENLHYATIVYKEVQYNL